MKRSYVLMGGVWLVMGGACKAPSTPPPKPQLTWQQFVKQPGELTSCLSEAVKPACMDGSPLLHEPGQPAKPFVSPCVYHAPDAPAPPHGYIISAAQFNEESVPHAIQLTFAKPIELEEIVHKLGVEHLENRAPTERFTNHRKITYARWFSPVADPGKAWLIEAQELADSPGKAIDVTVHVNPFDDVSRIRKLMIQSGFDVIDPAHVPPISFHPAMTEQASYPLIVRQTEHGVLINDTILSVSPTSKLDASARERFLGHVTTSMAKRQKQSEILKQPRLSNMYLDLTQQTPTHRALTLWREALALRDALPMPLAAVRRRRGKPCKHRVARASIQLCPHVQ